MTTATTTVTDTRTDSGARIAMVGEGDTMTAAPVAAIEVLIPIAHIHPDPFQPRIDCDAELAESIRTQGVLQAIAVEPAQALDAVCDHCGNTFIELAALGHFMINDGERRWRGSIAAKQTRILAKVIEPTEEGARLKRQLTANTGKPLTPFEEAIAFKRLMEVEEWSQVELAKQLGRPRATIGDRLRLVELDKVWLDLIQSGRLQISHAPIIHQYREVPAEYQAKAAEKIAKGEGWQMRRHKDEHDVIPVSDFRLAIREAFRDYIVKLDEVRSYKGPILEIEEEQYSFSSGNKLKKVKYAADIKLWRPIKNAAEKRAKERQKRERSSFTRHTYGTPMTKLRKRLAKEKIEIPVRATSEYYGEAGTGETVIFNDQGWQGELHPKVLLEALDSSKVAIVHGKHDAGGGKIVTSDAAAVEKERKAYAEFAVEATRKSVAPLRAKLTDEVLTEYAVKGPGAAALLSTLDMQRGAPKVVALAIGMPIAGAVEAEDYYDEDEPTEVLADASRRNAERLLSALAAVRALELKVPDPWALTREIDAKLSAIEFRLPKATTAQSSKKAAKREARARGEQVGDPSRAAVATA